MSIKIECEKIDTLIELAIQEDIGEKDITTESIIPDDLVIKGIFIAKESGIVAGLPVVEYFFSKLDKDVSLKQMAKEGVFINKGDILAVIHGSARTILTGERIALNFLQRLSGIATLTARFVEHIKPLKTPVMDTRKTIPGWRYLEKYAVAAGGGVNHRIGLYDQVLIKDNHLDIMKHVYHVEGIDKEKGSVSYTSFIKEKESQKMRDDNGESSRSSFSPNISTIENVVSLVKQKIKKGVLIEVETRTLEEVMDALKAGVNIILFDNMSVQQIKEAVTLVMDWKSVKGTDWPLTEASGNITMENVQSIARTGVDRISIGAITHSAKALDISLEINPKFIT